MINRMNNNPYDLVTLTRDLRANIEDGKDKLLPYEPVISTDTHELLWKDEQGNFVSATDAYSIDTIEDLKLKGLEVGTMVFLRGYYSVGDGAHHYRIISATDDGSGVLLANGLYANIVHNGEVNVSWFGARPSTFNEKIDVTPIIQNILKINKVSTIKFDDGFWCLSPLDIKRHNIFFKGSDMANFNQLSPSTLQPMTSSGVVFCAYGEQEYIVYYGDVESSYRNFGFSGIQFITNALAEHESIITFLSTGAKIAVKTNSCFKGKINEIVVTGINDNLEYGILFNGFETFFDNIMFRQCGKGFSDEFKYQFALVEKTEGFYSCPSGMSISNLGFEAGSTKFMLAECVDLIIDNINVEVTTSGLESVDPSSLPSDYTKLGVIDVNNRTYSIIVNNFSCQNLGVSFKYNDVYYSVDSFFRNIVQYGVFSNVCASNLFSQNTKKNVYAFSNLYGSIATTSSGNYNSKRTAVIDNVVCDNGYIIDINDKGNFETRIKNIGRQHGSKFNGNMLNVVSYIGETLDYKNNCLDYTNIYRNGQYMMNFIRTEEGFSNQSSFAFFKFFKSPVINVAKVELTFENTDFHTQFTGIFNFDDGTSISVLLGYATPGAGRYLYKDIAFGGKSLESLEIIASNKQQAYLITAKISRVETAMYESLDTPYYALKMQQEGIYEDYVNYRDELLEYEKSIKQNEVSMLPILQEPQIPETIKAFAEKYEVI